jgi:hypothetical protein
LFFSSVFHDVCCRARYYELYPMDFHWKEKVDLSHIYIYLYKSYFHELNFVYVVEALGCIHGWGTTFGTKFLRTILQWISAFIMIYYYLINKF